MNFSHLALNVIYTAGSAAYQAGAYVAPLAVNAAYAAGSAAYQAGAYVAPLAVNAAYAAGSAAYQAGAYVAPLAVDAAYTAGSSAYQVGAYVAPLALNAIYKTGDSVVSCYKNNQITPANTAIAATCMLLSYKTMVAVARPQTIDVTHKSLDERKAYALAAEYIFNKLCDGDEPLCTFAHASGGKSAIERIDDFVRINNIDVKSFKKTFPSKDFMMPLLIKVVDKVNESLGNDLKFDFCNRTLNKAFYGIRTIERSEAEPEIIAANVIVTILNCSEFIGAVQDELFSKRPLGTTPIWCIRVSRDSLWDSPT